MTPKPARCRHRNLWIFGSHSVPGQLHWCYECGAIRETLGDRAYRWTRPVGVGGVNPAMKEAKTP